MSGIAYFSQYGKNFQEKILQCLFTDRMWSTQMTEIMTPEYFELKYLQYLSKAYFSYYQKYKDFPTLPHIDGDIVDLPVKKFIEGMRSVYYSASISEIKPDYCLKILGKVEKFPWE